MSTDQFPKWSDDELEKERIISIDLSIKERFKEERSKYLEIIKDATISIKCLFKATKNLTEINGEVFKKNSRLLDPARYLGYRPVSQDDLDSFVGEKVSGKRKISTDQGDKIARILESVLDPIRFSWVAENRQPTEEEKDKAILSSSVLWTTQRLRTKLRMEASQRQEAAVIQICEEEGWEKNPDIKRIQNIEDLEKLLPGQYATHVRIMETEADVVVRLHNGILLAMECKVSNSFVNSIKRLNREVGGKAKTWTGGFGERVIPCATISGFFKLKNLKDAQQEYGILLFWDHNLKAFRDFIRRK